MGKTKVDGLFKVTLGKSYFEISNMNNGRKWWGLSEEVKSKHIGRLSKNSRNRMMKTVNNLHQEPELFISLSYANKFDKEPRTWHRHMNNLRRALVRKYPKAWFIWRLEPSKSSGSPHFHLLGSLNGTGDISERYKLESWLRPTWERISGVKHRDYFRGVNVRNLITPKDIIIRKTYICKVEDPYYYHNYRELWSRAGRRWGIINKKHLPLADTCEYIINNESFTKVKSLAIQHLKTLPKKKRGFMDNLEISKDIFVMPNDQTVMDEIRHMVAGG